MTLFHSDRSHPHIDDLIIVCLTGGPQETWLTVSHIGGVIVRENLPGITCQKSADMLSRAGIQAGLDVLAGYSKRRRDPASLDVELSAPASA